MSVVPTGPISLLFKHLQDQFADSSAFQTWVGHPGNAATAIGHAHVMADDDPDRPFVMITPGEDFSPIRIGEINTFHTVGNIEVFFVAEVSAENAGNHTDAFYEFTNPVGAILDGIKALSGQAGYLNITSMALEAGPMRASEEEVKPLGDTYFAQFTFQWQGA